MATLLQSPKFAGPWYVVVSTGPRLPRFFQVVQYGEAFSWTAPATLFVEELQFWKDSRLLVTQPVYKTIQKGDVLQFSELGITIS